MKTFYRTLKQAMMQREISKESVVFRSQNERGQFLFGLCHTKLDYCKFVLSNTPESRYCNEVLVSEVATFIDIDCPCSLEELGWESEEHFMTEFSNLLIACFKEYLGIGKLKKKNIHFSCSSRPLKPCSYHVVIASDDYFWPNTSGDLKTFINMIVDKTFDTPGYTYMKEEKNTYQKLHIIDVAVYTPSRNMRTVSCQKHGVDSVLSTIPRNDNTTPHEILPHLISVSNEEKSEMSAFALQKSSEATTSSSTVIPISLINRLAEICESKVHSVEGNLIRLRNSGKCRRCMINGEENFSDHSYMYLKNDQIIYCCFNTECKGDELILHTFGSETKHYEHYNDVILQHKRDPGLFTAKSVETYLLSAVKFIDIPDNSLFVTSSKVPIRHLPGIFGTKLNLSKSLFLRSNDIHLGTEDQVIKFSAVLNDLVHTRRIPTYTTTCYVPFTRTSVYKPVLPKGSLNLFTGFCIEDVEPKQDFVFTESAVYELLYRNLCNQNDELYSYLISFLSHKVSKPFEKIPICLVAISQPGVGKTSFSELLTRLFASSDTTVISYNNLKSFCSVFNSEKQHCQFSIIEECVSNIKDHHNFLKDMISSTSLLCEKKNVDKQFVPWYSNIIVFSNTLHCLRVDYQDRRLVFLEPDAKLVNKNKKEFFDRYYDEINDPSVVRSFFDYLLENHDPDWDYRKLPYSRLKERLQKSNADVDTRFIKYLFTEYFSEQEEYNFDEQELWMAWCQFTSDHGCKVHRERSWVSGNIELRLGINNEKDGFTMTRSYLKRALKDIGIKIT